MAQDIWLNLPVKNLEKSIEFFTAIGFVRNQGQGNTDQSASFLIGEKKIVLMLFTENVFSGFTGNALSNTAQGTEVLFSLGAESRNQVDDLANRAKSAGGTVFAEPRDSNGFMYGCGFCDPDGHRWNVLFMDTSKIPQ
ncbi:MAG: VOC family protein [Gammaproteobacteria bacterium]|nr:VOC family protein [Gammaproteobacteria bacterium]